MTFLLVGRTYYLQVIFLIGFVPQLSRKLSVVNTVLGVKFKLISLSISQVNRL